MYFRIIINKQTDHTICQQKKKQGKKPSKTKYSIYGVRLSRIFVKRKKVGSNFQSVLFLYQKGYTNPKFQTIETVQISRWNWTSHTNLPRKKINKSLNSKQIDSSNCLKTKENVLEYSITHHQFSSDIYRYIKNLIWM